MKTFEKAMLLSALLLPGAFAGYSASDFALQDDTPPAYHDHPPSAPLPETLDPEIFRDKPAAYVSYWIAARTKDLLYQEPCYCPCRKEAGHQSLFDCFVGRHGYVCVTCQKQAIFCFEERKSGKDPVTIRSEMARGKWWEVNLKEYAAAWFRERGK